jgi:hypothetical protein
MSTTIAPTQDRVLTTPDYNTEIAPIIIDLGKEKRKRIKDLKRGRGKLMAEVAGVINEARMNLGSEADGKEFIPVILIYRRKRKRKGSGFTLPLPFPFVGR